MNKPVAIAVSTAALAVVVLNGGAGMAKEAAATGTWPAGLPLPTDPGTLISQSTTRAAIRSTDTVAEVRAKLDDLYVTQKGCTLRFAVNKPKDYLCDNPVTRKSDEVFFTFAALDPVPTDPAVSETNAFYVEG